MVGSSPVMEHVKEMRFQASGGVILLGRQSQMYGPGTQTKTAKLNQKGPYFNCEKGYRIIRGWGNSKQASSSDWIEAIVSWSISWRLQPARYPHVWLRCASAVFSWCTPSSIVYFLSNFLVHQSVFQMWLQTRSALARELFTKRNLG